MAKKVEKPAATAKKEGVKKPSTKTKKAQPTDEEIQARAYEIYVERGFVGTDLENWLKAEKELTGKK